MRKFLFLFVLTFTIISCDKKFEKTGWNYTGVDTGDPLEYPNRDEMVNDLLKNHRIKGLNTKQVFNLLGETEIKNSRISYEILTDFGWDIDPIHTKYLEIKFNPDGIVKSAEIIEWKK
jgi:hypothetical protein